METFQEFAKWFFAVRPNAGCKELARELYSFKLAAELRIQELEHNLAPRAFLTELREWDRKLQEPSATAPDAER